MGDGKRPVTTNDLRPFSVEDPLGESNRAQVDARHRREDAAAVAAPAAAVAAPAAAVAAPAAAVAQQARIVAPPRQPKKKSNGSGCGCASLGCLLPFVIIPLVFLGVMASIVPTFWDMIQAWQLESSGTGVETAARVVSVEGSNTTFNDDTVWKIALEVQPQDGEPYEVTLDRALPDGDAEDLSEAGWVKVLVDPEDPEIVALSDPPYNPSDASVVAADAAPTADPDDAVPTAEPDDAAIAPEEATPDADPAAEPGNTATTDDAAVAAAVDAAADDSPKEPAPSCRETYDCCVIIQKGRSDGCDRFLKPDANDCRSALRTYKKIGRKVRRPCAP